MKRNEQCCRGCLIVQGMFYNKTNSPTKNADGNEFVECATPKDNSVPNAFNQFFFLLKIGLK